MWCAVEGSAVWEQMVSILPPALQIAAIHPALALHTNLPSNVRPPSPCLVVVNLRIQLRLEGPHLGQLGSLGRRSRLLAHLVGVAGGREGMQQ